MLTLAPRGTLPSRHAGLAPATGVVVYSEQRLVADGLRAMLRAAGGFAVPAVTGSVDGLGEAVDRLRPAAVLVDAGRGPGAARALTALDHVRPAVRIVVLADAPDRALSDLIRARGADALVSKRRGTGRDAVGTLREVLAGRRPAPSLDLVAPVHDGLPAPGPHSLSPRQRQVLRRVVAGYPNALIAEELHISVNTVKFHVRTIFRELGLRSRVDAARRFGSLGAGLTGPVPTRV
jgi:DNA-binding NarL/FixJ family response regulator